MTIKSWLKKIALFPMSMIMAVPGDDPAAPAAPAEKPLSERIMAFAGDPNAITVSTDIPDAAAEGETSDADQGGNQGEGADEGADTQSDEDGQDADLDDEGDADDSTSEESDESEEGKDTEHDKNKAARKTKEQRIDELVEKKVTEKLAAMNQSVQAEKPDFTVIDQEKVDAYIAEVEGKIDDLRMEGKYSEARKLSRQLDQLDSDLEENEKRRLAYIERQSGKKSAADTEASIRKELDVAAELYRDEHKIDKPTWDRMGEWFESQIKASKLLVEEFNDVYAKHGKVAAIRFAHHYARDNMGKKTKQANETKEKSKTTAAALTSTSTGKVAPIDLVKAKAEFDANPTPEAFTKYQEIKRRAQAA